MSFGVCMSVLIASIKAPLGDGEHAPAHVSHARPHAMRSQDPREVAKDTTHEARVLDPALSTADQGMPSAAERGTIDASGGARMGRLRRRKGASALLVACVACAACGSSGSGSAGDASTPLADGALS